MEDAKSEGTPSIELLEVDICSTVASEFDNGTKLSRSGAIAHSLTRRDLLDAVEGLRQQRSK